MLKRWVLSLLLSGFLFAVSGQEVIIDVSEVPLNEVLTELRDHYNVQLSFDDELLSKYSITLRERFSSPESAISKLLEQKPLVYEKISDVFIIYYQKPPEKAIVYKINGRVTDSFTGEPLPFSHVTLNEATLVSDQLGNFNYMTGQDSVFEIRATHLGYYVYDSLFNPASFVNIRLVPSTIGLKEVVIVNNAVDKSTQIGSRAGLMQLNQKVAGFLPGFGDNSVFNLLRLMPGVLASGESASDLVIWGSYAGQSQVLFDGFTIYGLKNYNDNISSFNPLMAQNIEVMKGGFDARYGERVGGIINIQGKTGNMKKPSFTFMINNMTLNGMLEVPLGKKASVVLAGRQTYFDLYNSSDINSLLRRNNDENDENDVDVIPDYTFRDLNFKYTQKIGERDLFYLSLYGGDDKFNYTIDQPVRKINVYKNTVENNKQLGGTAFYGKTWRNGNTSNLSISFSGISTRYQDDILINHQIVDTTFVDSIFGSENKLEEFAIKLENRFTLNRNHLLEVAGGIYVDQVSLTEDTNYSNSLNMQDTSQRLFFMLQDNIAIGAKTVLKIGGRLTHVSNLNEGFVEPRLSLSHEFSEQWKFNVSWGLYKQFITKSTLVDEVGNYRYFWTICDNQEVPVVEASHFVLGGRYHNRGWTVSVEGFYKFIEGITRYYNIKSLSLSGIIEGVSRVYGVDVFLQKDWNKHSTWISYSLGDAREKWLWHPKAKYRRAPHDQQHEIKLALLLNFDPLFFSTNYVYGSGFPRAPYNLTGADVDLTYSRWDASLIYKFLDWKTVGEVGLSVLNILNTRNIKYATFKRIPSDQSQILNINTESIPFTPALYLKFSF